MTEKNTDQLQQELMSSNDLDRFLSENDDSFRDTPLQLTLQRLFKATGLSKAALASIGLMFAVSYWNDYTNYKLYITTDQSLYNFQMKLRSIIMGSDLPAANGGAAENTVTNAAVIVAILPFMILYPFLQKYFVKGINIGAVKE